MIGEYGSSTYTFYDDATGEDICQLFSVDACPRVGEHVDIRTCRDEDGNFMPPRAAGLSTLRIVVQGTVTRVEHGFEERFYGGSDRHSRHLHFINIYVKVDES